MATPVRHDFADAEDLLEVETFWVDGGGGGGTGPLAEGGGYSVETTVIPKSDSARGLALKKIVVTKGWDGLFSWFGKDNQIYYLSVAFDLSGNPPVVMPPNEVKVPTYVRIPKNQAFEFTLGDGAPIFLPRQIVGGLGVYLALCEADELDKVGAALKEIQKDLDNNSKSFLDLVKSAIKNPAGATVSQVLSAGFGLLGPIGTALKHTGNDHIGMAQGTFPAKKGWDGRLIQKFPDGSYVQLAESSD